jgi:hypothetical protein
MVNGVGGRYEGERSSREGRGGRGEKGRPPIEEDCGRCARYQLVAAATYLPKGYLVAAATYLADSVALILRLGHETRCLYAALPVEAAAADASF